jgi:hypothetical protein
MAEASPTADPLAIVSDAMRPPDPGVRSLAAEARNRIAARERQGAADSVPRPADRPVPRPAPPRPLPSPSKESPAEIRLADGRRLRATIGPAPALRRDLDELGRAAAANERAAHSALDAQASQLELLRRSQAELAQKVDALQQQVDRTVLGLFDGFSGLEQRVETSTTRSRALAARQAEELRALTASSHLDKVSAVVNGLQSAAYGQSGSPFAPNNVALAANQLFWSFLEPLLKSFGIVSGAAPSVVTWLAPLGTLLTGQLVLADRQHVRFLSGASTFAGKSLVTVSLHDRVASGFRAELERRDDLAVTVTPVTPTSSTFRGVVRNGVLIITRVSSGEAVVPVARVAWVIDLGPDIG